MTWIYLTSLLAAMAIQNLLYKFVRIYDQTQVKGLVMAIGISFGVMEVLHLLTVLVNDDRGNILVWITGFIVGGALIFFVIRSARSYEALVNDLKRSGVDRMTLETEYQKRLNKGKPKSKK